MLYIIINVCLFYHIINNNYYYRLVEKYTLSGLVPNSTTVYPNNQI